MIDEQRFWKRLGWQHIPESEHYFPHWQDPRGEKFKYLPDINSLDALFKYAVPRLVEKLGWEKTLDLIVDAIDKVIWEAPDGTTDYDERFAQALALAIDKVMEAQSEKNKQQKTH